MITFPNESARYRTARERLLKKEIELRRAMEAVAEARRALPPGGLIRQDYVFDALDADGRAAKQKLSELFAPDKDTLILYQMMFPRHPQETRDVATSGGTARLARPDQPCPSCTALLDQWDGAIGHLQAAGFNFAVVAKTALENLVTLGRDRGWKNMRLVSSAANSFKRDYNAEDADGAQIPLLSVFHRDGDGIRHFWSSELGFAPPEPGQDPRAIGTCEILWNLMDFTPEGRPDWDEQLQYGEACRTFRLQVPRFSLEWFSASGRYRPARRGGRGSCLPTSRTISAPLIRALHLAETPAQAGRNIGRPAALIGEVSPPFADSKCDSQ